MTLTSTWVSGGMTQTVTATQDTDETVDELLTRFVQAVRKLSAEFPPDAP